MQDHTDKTDMRAEAKKMAEMSAIVIALGLSTMPRDPAGSGSKDAMDKVILLATDILEASLTKLRDRLREELLAEIQALRRRMGR